MITNFIEGIPSFASWSHAEKVKLIVWYLHNFSNKSRVGVSDIRSCYEKLNLVKPANLSSCVSQLEKKSPKQLIKDARGFYLESKVRQQLDKRHGQRPNAHVVTQILQDLPTQVQDLNERTFLNEALICFKAGAFRASIVMTWNLAYDHFCHWVLKKHIAAFNLQLPKTYPKASIQQITNREDFASFKEAEILQVSKSANIITADVHKIMKEKLDRRNIAAHPSSVIVNSVQAEDFISDLVNNVVVKLV